MSTQEQTIEEPRGFSIEIVPHGPALQNEAGALSLGIDSLPEPALIFSIDGTILAANAGAAKLFDAEPAELIGNNLYGNKSVDADQAQAAVASLIRGESIRFEISFQTKTGNELILEIMNLPFLSTSGAVERVLAFARDITSQKKAEHEQALLSALVKSSEDAIASLSTDFRITSWNRGAQKLLGYTAEEVIGRLASEVYVPPEGRKFARETMERDLSIIRQNPEAVRPVEVRVQSKDGAFLDVAILACGIWDTAGRLIGISTIMRDITERRRTEREKTELAAIVESSDDAIMTVGPDRRITYWNKGAERLFGFTAAEAIGSPLTLHIPAEEHARAIEISNRLMQHPEEVVRFERPTKRKDGTRIEVSMVVFAIRDSDGNAVATCAIARDVTERKQAEAEVTWLAAVVNASHDAIISVTPDSTIVTWNPAAEKVYGYTAEEAIGKGVDLFVPPEELERSLAATRRVAETAQPVSWEQTAFKGDGKPFVTEVNIFPIRDAAGKVVRVTGIGRDITGLKNIEKELREARDYNRGLIESSVDAMVVVDRDLHITDCNEQLAKLAEVPKKVLIGSRFDGFFTSPADAATAIARALSEGVVTNYDLVLRAAGGREILVSFNGSVFLRTGLVSGIFGVARDVTEQRAVQRRLADELNYSSSLVESSPDALLVTDSSLVFSQVNGQALRLTGYGRDDLLGIEAASIFTEAKAAQVLRSSLEQGIVRDAELCLLTRTAESIPVSLCASAFRDKDGSVRGLILAVRDISERKRAEKERALLASIVDASGDAIYSEAADLTITSWNAAAERLFGYEAEEIIGRNAAMLVPLERRAEVLRQVSIEGQEGQAERIETTRIRKGGGQIQVALTRSPIVDDDRKVVGFSVTAHDITERKRIEAELTAARDAALEAARVKAEFLANMSHEIRTPLNSVIGMTGLLLDTQLTAEQHEYAHDVRESGEALLALINEILDFSKLAAGKMAFEEIDFELGAAVSGAVDLICEQARRKDLELIISIDPDVPRDLRGDPARLRQVLLNLLGNAIKFTSRGEVALTVNKLSDNGKETMLRFEVRDTGVGIPKNKLHLLFQPFSQVDASTTRLFGGTGLGLSIARQIVERMGGSISVSSTEGAGSTFWFTAKFRRSGVVVKPAAECFASLSGRRLLIVDDNLNSLQILESQALAWKMDVEAAASADSALVLMGAAARSRPFEVALVDVKMPEVDGIELARIIKSDPKLAPARILLISSVGPESEFHERLQGIEIAGWLAKPISQSALYNALVKTLAGSKNAEFDPQTATASEPNTSALPSSNVEQRGAGRKLRVLLAEDNPINQKLAKFQLRKMGADVDCVANGREAVEAAIRLPYDAVLMDCQMPEMDGYEATREIRRLEGAGRHTPIIALTAHALSGDREACLAAGMDAYISKPVNVETLGSILGKVAQRTPLSPVQIMSAVQGSEKNPSTPADPVEKPTPPTPIAA